MVGLRLTSQAQPVLPVNGPEVYVIAYRNRRDLRFWATRLSLDDSETRICSFPDPREGSTSIAI